MRYVITALIFSLPAFAQEQTSSPSSSVSITFTEQEARETIRLLDLALKHSGLQAGSAVYLANKIEGAFQRVPEQKTLSKPTE